MKNIIIVLSLMGLFLASCTTKKTLQQTNLPEKKVSQNKDTIRIANDEIGYEVIIVDARFYTWLNSRAFPRNYHSLQFLENRNAQYVSEWNRRFLNSSYNRNLYDMQINYDPTIKYGYEVNYLIYNYFIYFQNTFKQQLFGIVPPR